MKSRILFMITILLACSILAVRAQDSGKQQQKPAVSVQQDPVFLPGDPYDPKMTPEQKEMLLHAGENNPSKPVIKQDSRSADFGVDAEKFCGSSNAKPTAGLVENPLKEEQERAALAKQGQAASSSAKTSQSPAVQEQPEGQKPKTVTDFRKVNGSNDQPASPEKGKVVNYREISGPNDQPKGTSPGK